MLSSELVPAIHASSYDAHRQVAGLEQSDDPVIDAFRAQAASVSVGVKAMMDRAVEENTSVILEGVSILPGMIDPEEWRDSAHVIFLAVATLEEEAFHKRFKARAAAASARATHRYVETWNAILRIQEHILELADHSSSRSWTTKASIARCSRSCVTSPRRSGSRGSSRMARRPGVVVLVLFALATGCVSAPSVEDERQVAQRIENEVRKQKRVLHDRVIDGYIDDLGDRLHLGRRPQALDYSFTVIEDDSPNAFANLAARSSSTPA